MDIILIQELLKKLAFIDGELYAVFSEGSSRCLHRKLVPAQSRDEADYYSCLHKNFSTIRTNSCHVKVCPRVKKGDHE